MKKGFLITFEGTEGCGKSTQVKLLAQYLKGLGMKVVISLEPGGTKTGREIRKTLLSTEEPLSRNTELFLFAADRTQHVAEVIAPGLEDGAVVIVDRYIDSTVAYQIGARKLPEELVRYLNQVSSSGIIPDLTILLDLSPMVGLPRAIASSAAEGAKIKKVDRFEKEKIAFHEEVRKAYLDIAANEPDRVKKIDAEKQGIETIAQEVKKYVRELLKI